MLYLTATVKTLSMNNQKAVATSFLLLLSAIIILGAISYRVIQQEKEKLAFINENCQSKLTINGSIAFFNGMDVFDTAAIERIGTMSPVEAAPFIPINEFAINDQPLLFHSADRTQTLVDSRYFSELIRVDAISADNEVNIGTAKPELLSQWTPGEIIRFLLESEIIKTYVHLDAELCLIEVTDNEQVYEERYNAIHSFCTNKCQEEAYQFTVWLEKPTGMLSVNP